MTTHIVTMGGGGFSMSPTGAPTNLDRYLVELTGRRSPLVCFVPTASADDPTYVRKFLTGYASLGVRTMVLTLWQDAAASLDRLPQADLVLVGGGSTVNLLALWRAHGVSPDAVIGHSMGEVTAAVGAGALTPAEGLDVIATRSRLPGRLDAVGSRKVLNSVLLASALKEGRIALDLDDLRRALEECVKPRFVALNLAAVDAVAAR